ncbi:flagellar hook-basal body protein [Mesobacillus foraminis]|uniref:flagellar hook-basal body protein n=1 Tax=Mesobacillus foraminis TaxID=279826 RepID=UPI001BEC3523|nr:flagellar hook-basal body protein [Mesobacillus foraminis]MBT2756664.1 flagellar hook-basal body protein [Mesobacillus foraminis]
MNRTMITATNTLAQLQKQMDSISHNIANANTNGYKSRETTFSDLVVQEFRNQPQDQLEENRLTPYNIRQGTGAKIAQSQLVLTQGALKTTDRGLDTAFTKEGQFYTILAQGEDGSSSVSYTRDGAFYLTPVSETESMVVTGNGDAVLDENGEPISFTGTPKEFKIAGNGEFVAIMADGSSQQRNLGVVRVDKPQFLEQKGHNLYGLPENLAELGVTENDIVTGLNGALRSEIAIQQHALEQSNVDGSKEMTDLLNVQRGYQFHSRSISIADQMLGLVNGIR